MNMYDFINLNGTRNPRALAPARHTCRFHYGTDRFHLRRIKITMSRAVDAYWCFNVGVMNDAQLFARVEPQRSLLHLRGVISAT